MRRAECRRDRGSGGRADLAHGPRCLPRNLTFCRECVCQRCDRRSVAQQAKRVCGVGCDGGVTIVQQGAQPRGARTPSLYPNLANGERCGRAQGGPAACQSPVDEGGIQLACVRHREKLRVGAHFALACAPRKFLGESGGRVQEQQ